VRARRATSAPAVAPSCARVVEIGAKRLGDVRIHRPAAAKPALVAGMLGVDDVVIACAVEPITKDVVDSGHASSFLQARLKRGACTDSRRVVGELVVSRQQSEAIGPHQHVSHQHVSRGKRVAEQERPSSARASTYADSLKRLRAASSTAGSRSCSGSRPWMKTSAMAGSSVATA